VAGHFFFIWIGGKTRLASRPWQLFPTLKITQSFQGSFLSIGIWFPVNQSPADFRPFVFDVLGITWG
jgi:hypothetical protein